ncbi:MAG: transaldolase family protein [Gemmatimonadaceae bacterium]
MRIFLATVVADEIRWAAEAGLLDGIVATPAVLAAELPHADPREVLAELSERDSYPIFASVGSLDADEITRGGRALAKITEHVIIAIPFVEDALPAIRRLSTAGVRCAATLVHSSAQGLLAARAGASLVVVAVDALEAIGQSSDHVIRELRESFDRSAVECDVVAAGPASASRFAEVAAAGADAVVVTPSTLRSFLQHPLTDRGVDRFLGDVSRRAKPRRAR